MLNIYKASAGSGKTYTLTRNYLQMMLGIYNPSTRKWSLRRKLDASHRHILAITFTNKATEEMTRRIIRELAILAGREPGVDSKSAYAVYFTKTLHTNEEELKEVASRRLDELLADFAFFHVSTIDAFFQSVLRTFAREVDLPDNFNLELNDLSAISIGVNEIFASINRSVKDDPESQRRQKWLEDWMLRTMEERFDQGKAFNIFSRSTGIYGDLVNSFTRLLNEDYRLNAEALNKYFSNPALIDAFGEAIKKQIETNTESIKEKAVVLMAYGDYQYVNNHVRGTIEKWKDGNFSAPSATVKTAVSDIKKRFSVPFLRENPSPSIDDKVQEICSLIVKTHRLNVAMRFLKPSISLMGLMGSVINYIKKHCRDNNMILLSETNSLLRRIINNDDTPFVYERLGYYLHHFLIDEFQDTSRMQWQNLRPLILESMSNEKANLIIGDEKQCIYRFRNSDPDLLGHEIEKDLSEIFGNESLELDGTSIEKNNNWRSSAEVIKFNNTIFHSLAAQLGVSDTYSTVIQRISPDRKDDIPGHVQLIFEPKATETPDQSDKSDRSDCADQSEDPDTSINLFSIEETVKAIDGMLSRGYRPHDIVVLVRTHSQGSQVIDALLDVTSRPEWKHGAMSISSADAVSLTSSPAVRLILEVLTLTQMPQIVKIDRNGKTEEAVNPAYKRTRLLYNYEYYLHRPITDSDGAVRFPTNDEALAMALDALRDSDLLDQLKTNRSSDEVEQLLTLREDGETNSINAKSTKSVTCSTLTSLVDRIISRFIHSDALKSETVFLNAFQDIVYDFCSRGNSDISSFLRHWNTLPGAAKSLNVSSGGDSLRVMTIHQSKGLEFPCVIIPFASTQVVKYHSLFLKSINWMKISKADFDFMPEEIVPPMLPIEFWQGLGKCDIFAKEFEQICQQQRIDNLNSAYVAFTRAVNDLVVICPRTSKKSDTLDKYILKAVKTLSDDCIADTSRFNIDERDWVLPLANMADDSGSLEIGTPTFRKEGKKKTDNIFNCSAELSAYNPTVNTRLVTMSTDDLEVFDYDNPRHRGKFLHRILSRVNRPADLATAVNRACRRAHLTDLQKTEVMNLLTAAVDDPKVAHWFDGYIRVANERTIGGATDPRGKHRRPDRIVWTADGHIDIIDFKFGEMHDSYRTQLNRYAKLMRESGHENVRAFIWFPVTGEILEILQEEAAKESQPRP